MGILLQISGQTNQPFWKDLYDKQAEILRITLEEGWVCIGQQLVKVLIN